MATTRQLFTTGKIFVFLTLLCFMLVPSVTFAHTGLDKSIPTEGETIQDLKEISLTFETKIEKGSTFSLVSEQGESIPVENITINDKVLGGTVSNSVKNGTYTVKWKIIGVDGHPIEGTYSFVVKAEDQESKQPTVANPSSQTQVPIAGTNASTATPEQNSTQTTATVVSTNTQANDMGNNSNIMMWLVIAIIVLAIVCILLIFRKKVK
ncbi:copper resistance protein CopC [Brevibacillus sp. 179-C 1.1 NHS]|uniref:copper resistance CopC family protein n=1 Tax=Brevibacillus sp. 179-C 1.1 NHS TaxID=3235177 RepID=UPI0039A13F33